MAEAAQGGGWTRFFKKELGTLGFNIGGVTTPPSETPITPIIVGEGRLAMEFSRELFKEGLMATGIAFPTVAEELVIVLVRRSCADGRPEGEVGGPAVAAQRRGRRAAWGGDSSFELASGRVLSNFVVGAVGDNPGSRTGMRGEHAVVEGEIDPWSRRERRKLSRAA